MEAGDRRVLVADDNKVNRFILQKFFRKWDIKADFVENGKDAVDAVNQQGYQLVIMDLHMPEMDGLEATKVIKSYGVEVAIIGLSASISEEERIAAKDAGMDDFIVKPFQPEDLRAKIMGYLDGE